MRCASISKRDIPSIGGNEDVCFSETLMSAWALCGNWPAAALGKGIHKADLLNWVISVSSKNSEPDLPTASTGSHFIEQPQSGMYGERKVNICEATTTSGDTHVPFDGHLFF